ncbi:phage tail assembly chaperone [Pseudomonas urmiensis]|uniref:phage tail assembly chaperone n=1 Tax=Pseudomonas urmiensis TaxID=2745493 RepID=UPI003D0C7DCF
MISDELFRRTSQETDGDWYLSDSREIVKRPRTLTVEQLSAIERQWRDDEVSATEWLVTRHRDEQDMRLDTTLTVEQFTALLIYRQALRDWPQDSRFPYSEFRPVAPEWVAEQVQ